MKVKIRINIHGIFCVKSATMVEKQIQAEVMETEPSTAEQKPAQCNSEEQQESSASDSVGKESGKETTDGQAEQSSKEASKGDGQSETTLDQNVEKESAQAGSGGAEEQQTENSMDVSDDSARTVFFFTELLYS